MAAALRELLLPEREVRKKGSEEVERVEYAEVERVEYAGWHRAFVDLASDLAPCNAAGQATPFKHTTAEVVEPAR